MFKTKLIIPLLMTLGIFNATLCSSQNLQDPRTRAPLVARQQQHTYTQLSKLPMTFEANEGQVKGRAQFISRGPGYSAFLSNGGMVLALKPARRAAAGDTDDRGPSNTKQHTILQFKLLGAANNPLVIGEHQLPGRVNYFLGKDPRRWRTNVAVYSQVRYKAVYPGVDLVYYGNARQLEYDFEVSPGVDPNLIRFEISGANQLAIDADGDLVLKTSTGELHFRSPVVYQKRNGQKVLLKGGYVLDGPTHVRFQVAPYDRSSPLVIDPVLLYSTYFGGNGSDEPYGMAVDGSGSIYLAGSTDSTDLPGMSQMSNLPWISAFVAKFDPTGSSLVYKDYFGGVDGSNIAYSVALDAAKNVYVTGTTDADDFPTVTPQQGTLRGSRNGFLSKISASGSSLLYSTYLGGSGFDTPSAVALDPSGNVFVAGRTSSRDFPTVNAYQPSMNPNQSGQYGYYGFVSKFNSGLSALVYSTYLGGNSMAMQSCWDGPCWFAPVTYINGLAVDINGNAYIGGITDTTNFPVTSGAYLTAASPQQNAAGVGVITKLNAAGTPVYSTYLYGSSGEQTDIEAITVDDAGSAYVTGQTTSDGSFPSTPSRICDPAVSGESCGYAFVTKLDATGSTLEYSTFLGPNNFAAGYAIALDSSKNAYVLGMTQSSTFQMVNGIQPFEDITTTDLLLVEIDATASSELFATYLGGGTGNEYPAGIAVDGSGNIFVSGETFSSDFPVLGGLQASLGSAPDAFVLRIGASGGANASASPATLEFAAQPIGSTSEAATTLVRNMGSEPLLISSITTTDNFSASDNCGTVVAAAGNCTITITFAPTGPGVRNGSVVIQSNAAAGSPQIIPLSGYASGASVSVDQSSLSFPDTTVDSVSEVQALAVTNSGDTGLSVIGLQTSGDFSQTNNCPASLDAGASCNVSVVFAPSVPGTLVGALAVISDAWASPVNVPLSGSGVIPSPSAPVASVNHSSLSFPSTALATSAEPQQVILSNTGNAALNLSAIQITGDFSQTNNCSAILGVGASCGISIVFTPSASGARTGALTITSDASGSPMNVSLVGDGADFTVTGSQLQATIAPGGIAAFSLSINPVGGAFTNTVQLSCSGAPANSVCSITPSATTPGSNPVTISVAVSTMGFRANTLRSTPKHHFYAALEFQGLGLIGIVLATCGTRRKRFQVRIAVMLISLLMLVGCAAPSVSTQNPAGRSSGIYNISITGTSGTLRHSVPLTVIVK